jgi:mannitol-1-phosphate 5-dehydrogenase
MATHRCRALIFGAGALGLGFLGERLAADYELCLADLPGREPFLKRIADNQGYDLNLCSPGGVELRAVKGAFTYALTGDPSAPAGPALAAALEEADLVLTAAGARALPDLIRAISPVLNARRRPAWLLFCENGRDIAARYGAGLGPSVRRVDTVMSRMCRFADSGETGYGPLWPGREERLVAESYSMIPLDRAACEGGPFSSAFTLVDTADFRMWEDVKLFMHNGLHAFVSYHASLLGAKRFPEAPAAVRAEALRVMREELVPAILFHHRQAVRATLEGYGEALLERFSNPWFNDSIERGVRGAAEKLAPDERLLGGRDYISEAGVDPRGYAATIDAARRIAALQGGPGGLHR